MKKKVFSPEQDGFCGAWYPNPNGSECAMILMLGDSSTDRMEQRLQNTPHECAFETWLYERGTHFAFPESMLKMILPVGSSLLVSIMFKDGSIAPLDPVCNVDASADVMQKLYEACGGDNVQFS